MYADVSFGKGAENGVHECVQDDVGIGMARQSAPVRDAHATERDVIAVSELMDIEAETGALLWKKKIEEHDAARLTGAPLAYNGNVFVPVASWEETRSLDANYPCCTFRGSIVALRVRDGQQVWKTYFVPEPQRSAVVGYFDMRFGIPLITFDSFCVTTQVPQ